MTRAAGAWAAAVAVTLGLYPAPAPALAVADQAGVPALELVEQTALTEPDGELVLRVRLVDVPADARLEVRVYDRVRSRSEFAGTVQGEGLRRELTSSRPEPVANLDPDAADTVIVRVPVRSVSNGDTTRLRLTASGVYPVELALSDAAGEPLASLLTHLIRLPADDDVSPPLAVAVIIPVHAPPALQPDGTSVVPDRVRTGIADTAAALAAQPNVAVTLLPTPETIDALAQGLDPGDESLLASLRDVLPGRQLLAAPYVAVNLNAFAAAGLDDELAAETARGTDLVTDQLARPDGRTWIATGALTEAALARLRGQGVDHLVVPEASLQPLDDDAFPVTLAQAFEVPAGLDSPVRTVMADDALAAHVGASDDPVLDAHRLLADLATVYFDEPPLSRGAVVAIPRDWAPSRAFLDALLAGLVDGRILAPVTIDGLFDRVAVASTDGPAAEPPPPEDVLVRSFAPSAVDDLGLYTAALGRARRALASYTAMIDPGSPRADPFEQRTLVAAADELGDDTRRAYLDAVIEGVAAEVRKIGVPAPQTITLTARNGQVPFTLRNDAEYPMHVVVRLESDKLEFPETPGGVISLELAQATTTRVEVPVRARTSGDTSVEISVTSPDGKLALGTARFTVRSTAVSGVGVVLSIGAGLFLLVWWGRNFHRTRRSRRLVARPR